jgi:hypothetical protein
VLTYIEYAALRGTKKPAFSAKPELILNRPKPIRTTL